MGSAGRCRECGALIPEGIPAGLCGRCLFALALEPGQHEPVGADGQESPESAQHAGEGDPEVPRPAPDSDAQDPTDHSPSHLGVEPTREQPGCWIGKYKLLERIGEGGFGVVYAAEQREPLKRQVALKIIKPGMDTRQVIARFEAERQALALMHHPNIATVFDAGATETGRPYFVMELVRGVPISQYCDEHHLPPIARLELFIQICRAVQHAHQKGVIHRDLKPSNVLVSLHDGVPIPKVIDFGIAKATKAELTNQTVYTQFQQFLGTPAYMSPEQMERNGWDVDTRSDIYSLGVLLYELLVGRTPFESKDLLEAGVEQMRRTIQEHEPERPSTRLGSLGVEDLTTTAQRRATEGPKLISLLRGDLDWIVMKCLEKDRTRRYETANGLARDIERHLGNEPVLARPQSRLYRLRKLFRRHKLAFASVVAIGATLVVGALVSTWLALQATQAKTKALAAEQDARAVLRFFQDKVLSAARPQGQEGGLGYNVTLREAIAAAEPGIAIAFTNQPEVEASIRTVVGISYFHLGDPTNALGQFERALALRKAKLGPDHPDTLSAMNNVAFACRVVGRLQQALELFEQTLQRRKVVLGAEHTNTFDTMNNLAISYFSLGRREAAASLWENTLRWRKVRQGPNHPETLSTANNLALCYQYLGRPGEAVKLLEDTYQRRVETLGGDHPNTLDTMNNLAITYLDLGRWNEALTLFERTLELKQVKLGADHPETLVAMNNVAFSYRQLGRRREALELFERTLQVRQIKLGSDHPDTLSTMNNLANCYSDLGRWDEARQLFKETLQRRQAKLGPDHPDTFDSMNDLAVCFRGSGRLAEALELCERTVQGRKEKLGADHPDTLASMNELGICYRALGRIEEASLLLEQTLLRRQTKLGRDHPDTLETMSEFVDSLLAAARFSEAEAAGRQCLARYEQKLPDHWRTFNNRRLLGLSLLRQNKYAEAEGFLLSGYEGMNQREAAIPSADRRYLGEGLRNLVDLYEATARPDEAGQWQRRLQGLPPAENNPL